MKNQLETLEVELKGLIKNIDSLQKELDHVDRDMTRFENAIEVLSGCKRSDAQRQMISEISVAHHFSYKEYEATYIVYLSEVASLKEKYQKYLEIVPDPENIVCQIVDEYLKLAEDYSSDAEQNLYEKK